MKKIIATLALSLASLSAQAYYCNGKVEAVDLTPGGTVLLTVTNLGEANTVCNLTAKSGNFTPEACHAIFSQMLAASMADKSVTLWFKNGDYNQCTKTNWGNFQRHGLYHLRVRG
ncbi:hypothetical protein PRUB_a5008 [Pseudoalteromonas rubra]|uniref:Uncharacterized protein n=1 Tax=Pseudoalteromonas rubra TaxID=43658 RepID=A0A8T0C3F5_9GAMM|nr:hypothetical protein [Pseudoalteromonas rubra]KAF7785239.1 hypothetical protein PRUB_a5008 [Pseudoalteromonas rubra]